MENPLILSLIAVLAVSLISLIGIVALSWNQRFLKSILTTLVGLAAGALLGDALIHLIPESLEELHDAHVFAAAVIGGFLFFFLLEKFLRWHHAHHGPEEEHAACEKDESPRHLAPLVLIADGIHNLVDGALIAASFLVSPALGVATTIAVFLHEIPQEIADFGLLIHSGLSRAKALLLNFASALVAFLGVGLAFVAHEFIESFEPLAIAFTAGAFIYIAAVDLIPELQKQRSTARSIAQIAAFMIGIGIMFVLASLFEATH